MRVRDECHPLRPGKSWQGSMIDEKKTVKITELKAQIERASYDVDVNAVAEAFVSRMLAVHGALRRADVRALLGDAALDEMRLTA